ncbi:MAG: helix-turn-helix transcriptional regulator [Bacteroides sp.]|nr:helix-turn-helix transcriptional regulator [Bacteroides sp.]MBD5360083.1 helix-turn-helix transcriptional regulator [Bacteroides sp.]MBD5361197.1 helix-turn-helix transcriptional regulator [Bacteroides sp.]
MANLQKIKVLAKNRGTTINDLAKQLGMTPQAIHLMVRENSTKTDTLERIARMFEVPISIFFDETMDGGKIQNAGTENNQSSRDNNTGINMAEHDELIKLREEVKYLKKILSDKDERIADLKERIEELKK